MPRPERQPVLPRGEDVGVEQLARAHHGVAHQRRGDARQRGVALGLVAVAPAVHQVGRPGGAHVGVVERLEHRRRLLREVGAVHVVDGVGQLAARCRSAAPSGSSSRIRRSGAPRGGTSSSPGTRCSSCADAGHDRGGADRRHRGKRGDAVGHVAAALDQRRRAPARRRRRSARSSISGAIASITQSTSLRRVASSTARPSAAQDAQPGVLLARRARGRAAASQASSASAT